MLFPVFGYYENITINIFVPVFCAFLWGIYLEVQILGHGIGVCSIAVDKPKLGHSVSL